MSPSLQPLPPSSDPPSGVRPREQRADDLDGFAGDALRDRRKWSRRLGVPQQDVEDLLQDALVLLVEHKSAVPPAARWSWLVSTLRNRKRGLARDRARARAREPALAIHIESRPLPFPPPDAEIADRIAAAHWLIEQVCASRRDVAIAHLCELRTLEEIASQSEVPLGTVRSRWERAKDDMRAALRREEAKRGNMTWLVALVGLLSGLWVWLTGSDAAASPQRSRGRATRLLAWAAVVAVALHAHEHAEPPDAARQEEAVVSNIEIGPFLPFLSASAEREREWTGGTARTRRAEATSADREMARGFLSVATSAMDRGDAATARDALRTYDFACADNPFPQQRAQLGASLATLDARLKRGLP